MMWNLIGLELPRKDEKTSEMATLTEDEIKRQISKGEIKPNELNRQQKEVYKEYIPKQYGNY